MSEAQKPLVFDKVPPVEVTDDNKVEVTKDASDQAQSTDVTVTSAARELHVTIKNDTGHNLILADYGKSVGSCWEKYPPSRINTGTSGSFQNDSDGFMEGAHGWVRYRFEDDGGQEYYIRFDNPYYGSNSYGYRAPWKYGCRIKGGGGNKAWVTFECFKS